MIPAALLLVNNDLTPAVQNQLVRQLFINEVIDGYTCDQRFLINPTYNITIKRNQLRVMVVRNFTELTNRNSFDLVAFVKSGLMAVELNKFGPHGLTLPLANITWGDFGIF